jgi:hypothetical protein
MHAEIELVKGHVLGLFERQREYLKSKPTPFLEELLHRCEDREPLPEFSTVVASEINRAAATLVLESRALRPDTAGTFNIQHSTPNAQ